MPLLLNTRGFPPAIRDLLPATVLPKVSALLDRVLVALADVEVGTELAAFFCRLEFGEGGGGEEREEGGGDGCELHGCCGVGFEVGEFSGVGRSLVVAGSSWWYR
jgi:hypothetical protein